MSHIMLLPLSDCKIWLERHIDVNWAALKVWLIIVRHLKLTSTWHLWLCLSSTTENSIADAAPLERHTLTLNFRLYYCRAKKILSTSVCGWWFQLRLVLTTQINDVNVTHISNSSNVTFHLSPHWQSIFYQNLQKQSSSSSFFFWLQVYINRLCCLNRWN